MTRLSPRAALKWKQKIFTGNSTNEVPDHCLYYGEQGKPEYLVLLRLFCLRAAGEESESEARPQEVKFVTERRGGGRR